MADGPPNCRGPLVFELTLPNERYATGFVRLLGLVDGNYRVEIYIQLLDLTRNSCEKCNYMQVPSGRNQMRIPAKDL